MGFSYLNGQRWANITREERFFCAELYEAIKGREKEFVAWLNRQFTEPLNAGEIDAEWEVAFEVCFYRDLLHAKKADKKSSKQSLKRTFDICLFSERVMIVIEAKAAMGFGQTQLEDVRRDRRHILRLFSQLPVPKPYPRVLMVGLVSSRYTPKAATAGVFDGLVRWKDLAELFPGVEALKRADEVFRA